MKKYYFNVKCKEKTDWNGHYSETPHYATKTIYAENKEQALKFARAKYGNSVHEVYEVEK
ncbi:MAG: hypothetical protein IJJ10_06630 [Bacillus sp. (in: Bacteria)]|nr:hypothetical protein [Bacillus sp. (in: firmicutes)]